MATTTYTGRRLTLDQRIRFEAITAEVNARNLDDLVREHTAAKSFADLCEWHASYRPTLHTRPLNAREHSLRRAAIAQRIADAYDMEMMIRNDPRRAFRDAEGR